MYYNLKQTTKETNFSSQSFGGLGLTLSTRPYQITFTIPGTIRKSSPELFPKTGQLCDGTDTEFYKEPDADTNVAQASPTLTSSAAQNMIYVIIRSQIAIMITDIVSVPLRSTERIRTLSGSPRSVL